MAPDQLLARRRKARDGKVEVLGYTFSIRRPKAAEAAVWLFGGEKTAIEICCEFVTGWSENVTDAVLVPGGGSDPAAFDKALWQDWCEDEPRFWKPISDAINESYVRHAKGLVEAGNA